MEDLKKARYQRGIKVGLALAALTAFEFWVASVASGPMPYPVMCMPLAPITWLAMWVSKSPFLFLALSMLTKAALIVNYYMHLGELLGEVG
jgi:hypothetical protein